MALEVATYISQLDPNWPLGTDKQDRGDDHLRLIKDVLKKTLAGPNGTGWEKPVTASPDQINAFNQRITDLENGLKNVYKIGDLMIRADNVNPATIFPGTTWTLITGDFAVRLGNGSNGGQTLGNNDPVVPVAYHSHGASVSINADGNHAHTMYMGGGSAGPRQAIAIDARNGEGHSYVGSNNSTEIAGWHAHSGSVSVGASGTQNATLDVRGARLLLNFWKRVS